MIFGVGDGAYVRDVTATDPVRALCAAAAALAKLDGVPLVTLWNHIYFGNARVKPIKARNVPCDR